MAVALRRGRQPKARPILAVRELVREDLEKLKERRTTPLVQRYRDTHHRLARLLATGLRVEEVAQRSGYSHSRVGMFSADPAFQELIAHYRGLVTQGFVEGVDDYFEVATSNMLKAERQLAEKLDQADEDNKLLPTRDLIAISRDAADRFGYGKKQTNLNVNVDFASQLEKAIKRSGKVIDAIAKPVGEQRGAPRLAQPDSIVPLQAPSPPSTRARLQPTLVIEPPFRRRA